MSFSAVVDPDQVNKGSLLKNVWLFRGCLACFGPRLWSKAIGYGFWSWLFRDGIQPLEQILLSPVFSLLFAKQKVLSAGNFFS